MISISSFTLSREMSAGAWTGVEDRCLYARPNGRGLINLTQINLKQENPIEALKENRLMSLILRKSLRC